MTYNRFRKKTERPSILTRISSNVSRATQEKLHELSIMKRVPVSTLIARAIRNEFLCPNPFEIDLKIPIEKYKDENTLESRKLFDFIRINPYLSLEHFLILKDDIGIPDEETLKLAYYHLLQIELIEEMKPVNPKVLYKSDYRVVKIKPDPKLLEKRKPYKEITKGPLNEIE